MFLFSFRLQSPGAGKLCMKTFRPFTGNGPAPLSSTSLHSPLSSKVRSTRDHSLADQSRRDSGVLFDNDDTEQNSNKASSSSGCHDDVTHDPFDDAEEAPYHDSIVAPKFNFQSLNLVASKHYAPAHPVASSRAGVRASVPHAAPARTSKSRSSVDSAEFAHLDQLIESMNIQTHGLAHPS